MKFRLPLGIVDSLPLHSRLYNICKRYIHRYDNDNNSDMTTNGEMHWLTEVLGACDVVFDVGANIGDWTNIALGINPNLYIHCFEPSVANFTHLQGRSFVNDRVVLNNIGLADAAGEVDLHVYDQHTGLNSIFDRTVPGTPQSNIEKIKVDTLDDYCVRAGIEQIDLLKVDVEGYELTVFKGAQQLLARGAIKRIQFEYGGTYLDARVLFKDVFDLFTSHGYTLHKIYPDKLECLDDYKQSLENFLYQNWVALR